MGTIPATDADSLAEAQLAIQALLGGWWVDRVERDKQAMLLAVAALQAGGRPDLAELVSGDLNPLQGNKN